MIKKNSWLKYFFIILVLFIHFYFVYSAPYHGEIVEFEQPDGSKVKVKLYGDEYYLRAESLDGYTLIRDTQTGWICYADINEDGTEFISSGIPYKDEVTFEEAKEKFVNLEKEQKKIQKIKKIKQKLDLPFEVIEKIRKKNKKILHKTDNNNLPPPASDDANNSQNTFYPAPPTRKALGTIKGLVIVVDFPDAPATLPIQEYERWFNDMNYNNFGNNGSVRKYFYDVSGGKLDYQGVVFGIFRAPNTFAYYDSLPYAEGARQILAWVLPIIDQQGFDFSTLTTDSNRRILAINFVYTGNPRAWAQGMWYHQGWYTGFTADGVRTNWYACASANSPLRIGTLCHENGHMICGWPDTYKYNSNTGPDGIGQFDLMCGGTYPENNPTPPNPYFLYTVGWAELIEINDWGARIIFDIANDLTFYRYRNPNNSKEFYILNAVRKTGRYANVPDEGLTIWHIDEDGDNQTTHHMVFLEHANNNINDHTRACFRADRGYDKFNDYTTPSAMWYSGDLSFFNLCSISNVSSTMTYRAYDLNKEWYFLTGQEGWSLANNVSGNVSGGVLNLNITGGDPYIHSPDNLNISASTYRFIKIRLKNTSNGNEAKFYWITTSNTQWNETKSISFTTTRNDTDFKEYIIDLTNNSNWTGTLKQIRFDPPGSSGSVSIDYIKLEKDKGIVSGKIYAIKSKHSSKFISVQNDTTEAAANIVQYDYQGLLSQCWKVEDVGDSYYRFTSLRSNLVFDVRNVDVSNGADLIQWSWCSEDSQKFKLDGLGGEDYRLTARHSGRSLDVNGWSLENNAKIIQWDWHGGNNQRWNFVETYELQVSVNPSEAGTVTKNLNYQRYLKDTTIHLTALPSKGYRFVNWSGDFNSSSSALTFNITDDIDLTANFTLTTHTVVVSVFPENAATVDIQPRQQIYTYGTHVTFTVTASEGYEFIGWSGSVTSSDNPLSIVVEENINLVANLRLTTHTLTVNVEPSDAALVEINPIKDYYTYFDTVTIKLNINEGYEFLGWSGSFVGFDNPLLLKVKGDVSLTASLKLTTHTISVEINPTNAGLITKHPELEFYTYGTTVTIIAEPLEGYWFDNWSGDVSFLDSSISIVIKNNLSLKANFVPSLHTVNLVILPKPDAGSVRKIPEQLYYTYGTTITIQAVANEGWEFVGWYEDDQMISTEAAFETLIKKDKILTASFKLTTHTVLVTMNPLNAGSFSINPFLDYYNYGTEISITAIPQVGWEFVGWTGDVNSNSNPLNLEVKKNLSVYANFKLSTYTIIVNINPPWAGEVRLVPELSYYTYGTTVTIQAIPDRKHKFERWEGDLSGSIPVLTFIVDGEKRVTAKFLRKSDFLLTLNMDGLNDDVYFGEDVEEVSIFSPEGKKILNIKSNILNNKLDSFSLKAGFYILKIKTKDGKERFDKLVVVR